MEEILNKLKYEIKYFSKEFNIWNTRLLHSPDLELSEI